MRRITTIVTFKHLRCYFCVALLLTQPTIALAQNWDRSADGRTIVVVKGNKFVFPSEGYDVANIRFDWESLQDRATLPEVIAAPEKARAVFERRPHVSISLGVAPDYKSTSLFWNKYDRDSFRSHSFGFSIGENQSNCQYWAKEFERVRAIQDQAPPPDGTLWREYPGGSATVYIYVGPRLDSIRPGLQNLVCNLLSYCSGSVCLAPNLSFGFSFWSKAFPQEKWIEVLNRVDAILTSVLDEPAN